MLGQRTRLRKFRRGRLGRPRKVKKPKPQACGARPGFENTRKLCQMVVESPDQRGKYVEVTKNIFGSWSSTVRVQIEIDSAKEKAGDRFQCLYERRASTKVLSTWRVLERKGNRSGSVPIRALTTGQQLAEVQCRLGRCRFLVLELICGLGLTLQEATQRYFGRSASREDEVRVLDLLLEALDQLALHWGYATGDKCQPNESRVGQA